MNSALILLPPTIRSKGSALRFARYLRDFDLVGAIYDASGFTAAAQSGFKDASALSFEPQIRSLGAEVARRTENRSFLSPALHRRVLWQMLAGHRIVLVPNATDWSLRIEEEGIETETILDWASFVEFVQAIAESPSMAPTVTEDGTFSPRLVIAIDKPDNVFGIPPIDPVAFSQLDEKGREQILGAVMEVCAAVAPIIRTAVLQPEPTIVWPEDQDFLFEGRTLGEIYTDAISLLPYLDLSAKRIWEIVQRLAPQGVTTVRSLGVILPKAHSMATYHPEGSGGVGFGKALLMDRLGIDADEIVRKVKDDAELTANLTTVGESAPSATEERPAASAAEGAKSVPFPMFSIDKAARAFEGLAPSSAEGLTTSNVDALRAGAARRLAAREKGGDGLAK
ncbi:hypothetical protein SAMN05444156_2168 [Verrucomicrobium sp. GAS474]|uniref:hypothetical protein n=1 Tax=Verrucomicrobium sp. GAS474 TaxID=1882831 RepID=UPI0008793BF8|nr:hypothetical protein [Verrucomicrobium sp. GAS474]SDU13525.1 hypothetical protein SAMN05444156_2168 [Verrucomicrobium sp. GAS474]